MKLARGHLETRRELRSSTGRDFRRSGSIAPRSGFTLVEIALCLAIVGFAAVAIVGVLPLGMTVQKENREDTIIRQDGMYFLEAIRSGSRGIDDLTNYVDQIVWSAAIYRTNGTLVRPLPSVTYAALQPVSRERQLTNGHQIVTLLSTPKYLPLPPLPYELYGVRVKSDLVPDLILVSTVSAIVRSMNGVAADKDYRNLNQRDFAFKYLLRSEIVPQIAPAVVEANAGALAFPRSFLLTNQLHHLNLTLSWPVFERGANQWQVGGNRKTLRTLVAGNRGVSEGGFLLSPGQYDPFR